MKKLPTELPIGAHESTAGGVYTAFDRARRAGCTALQVFTKNNNQWRAKPLSDGDIENYKTAASNSNVSGVVAHACYLINLCALNKAILKRSIAAMTDELTRCDQLGITGVVVHPGSHLGAGEDDGIKKIAESLDTIHSEIPSAKALTILETTAGQGSAIGYKFEHLRAIIDLTEQPQRIGICLDTCHIFAAGYDIRTEETYHRAMAEFDNIIGLQRLIVIHTNDSRKPLGSRVDRHEHIGKGMIGKNGFRWLMKDNRIAHIPKILETQKSEDLHEDKRNIGILRRLARQDT
jgi:deoxyribonuclease IV